LSNQEGRPIVKPSRSRSISSEPILRKHKAPEHPEHRSITMSPPSADDYDDHRRGGDRDRDHEEDGDEDRRRHPHHRAPPPPPSKFDLRLNPPYQIDFANVAAGKTIAATKRRVRFRFGFSNKEALEQGKIGVDCRGEEHEVVIVISALSGKRHVFADGHEVHFSYGSRTDSTFETAWTMKGGHLVKVRGHVALPLFETPGFRQFDLTIDGLSYFSMPKLYELGIKKPVATAPRLALPRSVSPSQGDGEQGYEASYDGGYSRRRSTPDHRPSSRDSEPSRSKQQEPASTSVVSRDEPVDILSDASMALSSSSSSDLLSSAASPSLLLLDSSSATYAAPKDEFAPVEAPPAAPASTFASVSHSILSQYGPSSASASPSSASSSSYQPAGGVLALANESHTYYAPPPQQQQQQQAYYPPHQPSYAPPVTPSHSAGQHQQSPQSYYGGGGAPTPAYNYGTPSMQQQPQQYPPYSQQPPSGSAYYAPVSPEGSVRSVTTMEESTSHGSFDPSPVKLTMQPLTLEEVDEVLMQDDDGPGPKRPLTDVEKAMASLVNLGDIKENKLTPEQRKAMQAKEQKLHAKKKSQPAPPAAPTWRMGDHATLGDLQQTPKDATSASKGPPKEIMRTHAFDPRAVHAGMMVVYGSDPNSGGGIPPSPGFGAGAAPAPMSHYAPNPHQYHQQQPQYQQNHQQQPPYAVAPAQIGY
jgi:hypothetical protein